MSADETISLDNVKVQHLLQSMTERNQDSLLLKEDLINVKSFDEIYAHLSKEEIFVEYVNFLRTFPDILDSEKKKLVNIVKRELKNDDIVKEIQSCDFDTLVDKHESSHLIDHLSTKLGFSLKIVCPPVKSCILCESKLTLNNKATQVIVHTMAGPQLYSKYIYRCRNCKLVKKSKVTKMRKNQCGITIKGDLLFK